MVKGVMLIFAYFAFPFLLKTHTYEIKDCRIAGPRVYRTE